MIPIIDTYGLGSDAERASVNRPSSEGFRIESDDRYRNRCWILDADNREVYRGSLESCYAFFRGLRYARNFG